MRTINGIPRDAVAFAAGIHSVAAHRSWEEVAEALNMLGFGRHDAYDLELAVGEWGIQRVDIIQRLRAVAHPVASRPAIAEVDRGRVVRRGGGFKS